MIDKVFAFLHSAFSWLPKLGGGKSWLVKDVRVQLWPFVAVAIFIVLICIYHFGFAYD